MTNCLVCDKPVNEDDSKNFRWHHTDGKWYRFNDIGCRNKFIGNPEKYLQAQTAS
jgi:hypothetical protein